MNKKHMVFGAIFVVAVFLLRISLFYRLVLVVMVASQWFLSWLLPRLEKLWLSLLASMAFSTGMTMLTIRFLSTQNLAVEEWWLYVMTLCFITTIAAIQELHKRRKASFSVKEYE